jgi:hypothetical protein
LTDIDKQTEYQFLEKSIFAVELVCRDGDFWVLRKIVPYKGGSSV